MNDQQFQEQLLLAEHPAPAGVWNQLLEVLEQDADDTALQTELNFSSITPPVSVWNIVEQELEVWKNDELFATSINQNSVTAPALLWNNIEALLDADADKEFADLLNTTEVKPPADAWTNIENELHPQAKIIPITKRYATIYRMAAAAVIIGFVTWGIFQMLPKQTTQVALVENKPAQENITTTSDSNTKKIEPAIVVSETNTADAKRNNLLAAYKPKQSRTEIATDDVMQHEKPSTAKTNFSETNYLIVLNDDGDLIRVSKKLSTMDCAQNGDVPVDAITTLQGKDCDARIKKIQQKMATSLMGSIVDPIALTNSTDK